MGISVDEIGKLDPYTYNDLLIRYLRRQAIESGKLVIKKKNMLPKPNATQDDIDALMNA